MNCPHPKIELQTELRMNEVPGFSTIVQKQSELRKAKTLIFFSVSEVYQYCLDLMVFDIISPFLSISSFTKHTFLFFFQVHFQGSFLLSFRCSLAVSFMWSTAGLTGARTTNNQLFHQAIQLLFPKTDLLLPVLFYRIFVIKCKLAAHGGYINTGELLHSTRSLLLAMKSVPTLLLVLPSLHRKYP